MTREEFYDHVAAIVEELEDVRGVVRLVRESAVDLGLHGTFDPTRGARASGPLRAADVTAAAGTVACALASIAEHAEAIQEVTGTDGPEFDDEPEDQPAPGAPKKARAKKVRP